MFAVLEGQQFVFPVDARNLQSQQEANLGLLVNRRLADEKLFQVLAPGQKVLGQGRAVIGQEILLTDNGDGAFPALLTQRGGGLGSGVAGTDNNTALIRHCFS